MNHLLSIMVCRLGKEPRYGIFPISSQVQGDYVFCGPSMVFTNIRLPRSEFPQQGSKYYEKTLVKKSASIGANATIVCGITIGEYALIGSGSVVTKDVPAFALVTI